MEGGFSSNEQDHDVKEGIDQLHISQLINDFKHHSTEPVGKIIRTANLVFPSQFEPSQILNVLPRALWEPTVKFEKMDR